MSNLFYRTDEKNNIGVGTNAIVATSDFLIDFSNCNDTNTIIKLNDNLDDALNIKEGTESYMKFVTTNNNEEIILNKNSTFNGKIQVNDNTEATSTSDGSLQTDGGLSVLKVFIINPRLDQILGVTMGSSGSATVSANGMLNINNDTDATATSNVSLQANGVYQLLKYL